jgi:PAT family beta-lactamase induction signal transducer AmpG
MSQSPASVRKPKPGARHVFTALGQPKVAVMLALGFGSGLPFLLTGNTFGYWLRDAGASLKAIGFLSWVGIAYSVKYLWAPLIDRLDAPLVGRWLGRRRGWMLIAQFAVGGGLIAMAAAGPAHGLALLGAFALVVAFASSTQDTVVDAWRIESAADSEELGLLSSAYQLGYRAALLATDALIVAAAARIGWAASYAAAGLCMAIGVAATLFAIEPARADAVLSVKPPIWTGKGLFDAVIGPFIAFFRAHREFGVLMLAAVALYRLPDFVMGPMANPYYHDIGVAKDTVAFVRGTVGLAAGVAGIAAGGLASVRLGFFPSLILGAVLQPLAVAAFAFLAYAGANPWVFGSVMALDNFSMSFAGVALVAYMSSLTGLGYTATQYALLSSTYALLGKFLKGFSGVVVESLHATRPLGEAYAIFFVGAGLIGVPALILFVVLATLHRRRALRTADTAATP